MTIDDRSSKRGENSTPNTSRRRYLRGLVGGGIAGVGLSQFDVVKGGGTVSVPIIRDKDGVVETKDFPEDWNSHRLHAETVNDEVQSSHMDDSGVKSIGLIRSDLKYGGLHGFEIRVEIVPEEYKGGIPDSVSGIPINLVEATPVEYGACGVTQDRNNIPGGVSTETEDSSGNCPGVPFGTLCCRVYDGSSLYMLSARHVWAGSDNPCSTSSVTNDPVYHMSDEVGEIDDEDMDEDWVLIDDTSSNEDFIFDIYDPWEGTDVDIGGFYTKAGVADLIETEEQVRSIGVTTGTTWGTVEALSIEQGWDCVDWASEGIECAINFGDGDSGGPVYNMGSEGNAVLITFNSQQTGSNIDSEDCHPTCADSSFTSEIWDTLRGTSFYWLNNAHGISPG